MIASPSIPGLDDARKLAQLGARLADHGHPDGAAIRRQALQSIRCKRRAHWRALVAERIELGTLDLGEAGA